MDSIAAAKSGHLGLPLGAAEMGAVLFGQSMTFNPDDPTWVNRDRFVLSAGHGSMFLYSWLHLAGYDIPKDEVANFRQHHSATPGHPEFPNSEHTTPGIEGAEYKGRGLWVYRGREVHAVPRAQGFDFLAETDKGFRVFEEFDHAFLWLDGVSWGQAIIHGE